MLTSRPARHRVEGAFLARLTATNKTVEQYRNKVVAYLDSPEFKQRWDALKAQVGSRCSSTGACWGRAAMSERRLLRHATTVDLGLTPQNAAAVAAQRLPQQPDTHLTSYL